MEEMPADTAKEIKEIMVKFIKELRPTEPENLTEHDKNEYADFLRQLSKIVRSHKKLSVVEVAEEIQVLKKYWFLRGVLDKFSEENIWEEYSIWDLVLMVFKNEEWKLYNMDPGLWQEKKFGKYVYTY